MQQQDTGKKLEELVIEIDNRLERAKDPQQLSSLIPEQKEDGDFRRCVLLSCGEIDLAVPLEGIAEITGLSNITTLPNLPRWIQGVTSVRGEVISIVDIRDYRGWPATRDLQGNRLVVIQHNNIKIGLRADIVVGSKLIDFTRDVLQDLISSNDKMVQFPEGVEVDRRIYCLISPEQLLTEKKMTEL